MSKIDFPKNYNETECEAKWQKYWEENKIFAWNSTGKREDSFVIDTPPPTISGSLHIGHIYSYTHTDFMARYKRMQGFNVFYPMGFDDNGLPTERLVEKEKKTKAAQHSREEFTAMCNETAEKYRKEFRELFTNIALSVDWNQEYHTISEDCLKISQMSFLDLYRKGEVYRKLQPMFWDPIDQTAIAQAEIEEHELDSFENYIYFGLVDEGKATNNIDWDSLEKVEIMTTRPEMLPACVALMVHPDDLHKYKGKKAVTPLYNTIVPIVADEDVKKDKGTGVVMCCTFGDEQDIKWWQKHSLETRIIINKFGKIDFTNLDFSSLLLEKTTNKKVDHQEEQFSARKTTIKLLEEHNLTVKPKVAIKHMVKCAERSGSPLEIIPTEQWFVAVTKHKKQLLEKVNECNWNPSYMAKRAEQWIESLEWDWCISRQRYFGVPFPVWYSKRAGEHGKILLPSIQQLPVNPLIDLPEGYSADEVTPEKDVMDTWATSSVSPQINSKAITKDFAIDIDRHQQLYPADLRPQAHEIIRTWAFYTIAKSYLHENTIPWKNLMISGWCLAEDKSKMSKSKGNIVRPQDILKNYSADNIRYWSSTSKLGADTAFSQDVLKVGKKLINKLWNAAKFSGLFLESLVEGELIERDIQSDINSGDIFHPLDKWILSELNKAIISASENFEIYEYSVARKAAEDFFWLFCDYYLEAVKTRVYDEQNNDAKAKRSGVLTLSHILKNILKLFAPFMPHITDELYNIIFHEEAAKHKSIHAKGQWAKSFIDDKREENCKNGEILIAIMDYIRGEKSALNLSIKYPVKCLTIVCEKKVETIISSFIGDLKAVTSIENIEFLANTHNHIAGNDFTEIKDLELNLKMSIEAML